MNNPSRSIASILSISLFFAGIIGTSGRAWAEQGDNKPSQERGRTEGRSGPILDHIRSILDDMKLSAEQQKQVREILTDAATEMGNMREKMANMEPRERQEQIRTQLTSLKSKIAAVLTDEQKQVLESKLEEMRRQREGGAEGRGAGFLDAFKEAIAQLDLSADQKSKIDQIMLDTRGKLTELREKMQNDREKLREQLREIMQNSREQVSQVLSAEQQQKLRELVQDKIQKRIGDGPRPGGPKPDADRPNKPEKTTEPKKMGDDRPDGQVQAKPDRAKPKVIESAELPGPSPGDAAPAFKAAKLDGSSVQLSAFKGKPLVLIFGSYTCPAFRDRVGGLEDIKRQVGSSANFLIVYTKEAHPKGGWEVDRNKEENIVFDQPADEKSRLAMAKLAKDKLKISIPIAVDSMDDAMIRSYGGFPNGTVVIARNGTLSGRQKWTDPSGLKRLIDEALTTKAATQPVN